MTDYIHEVEPELKPEPESLESIERRAALILRACEEEEARAYALANPTPENLRAIRTMVDDIREALDLMDGGGGEIARLTQQAAILHKVFQRLLYDADVTYENSDRLDCDPMKYAAAFKAQDQYRRTVKTLKALKNMKKERVKPKKCKLKPHQRLEKKGKNGCK